MPAMNIFSELKFWIIIGGCLRVSRVYNVFWFGLTWAHFDFAQHKLLALLLKHFKIKKPFQIYETVFINGPPDYESGALTS